MTPEQMRRAKSIVEYAAVESLETEEIVLLGWAIQAIAARDAEIADLKRGRVVVELTELSEEPVVVEDFADNGAHSQWRLVDRSTGETLWEEATRTIPADRVLGEGMVAVGQEELEALRDLLDCARIAAHAVEDDGECETSSVCDAVFTCDSLHANQGGLNHVHV